MFNEKQSKKSYARIISLFFRLCFFLIALKRSSFNKKGLFFLSHFVVYSLFIQFNLVFDFTENQLLSLTLSRHFMQFSPLQNIILVIENYDVGD